MEKYYDIEIGFVILHYCAITDTQKCVESVFNKLDTENFEIFIIDNASPDGSGKKLKTIYLDNPKINILLNKRNLGFASGNNLGIKFAKAKKCKFICVTNNDTYLIQNDFFKQITDDYDKYKYFVLGPKVIISNPDLFCNPMGDHIITYKESRKKLISLRIQLLLNYFNLDSIVKKINCRKKSNNFSFDHNEYYINVKLHGCCLIFSPDFIEIYDGFPEGTFLYLEEEFLYIMLSKKGHKTLYSPLVTIYHSEDASTNSLKKSDKMKMRFVLLNHIKSMKVISYYLKE